MPEHTVSQSLNISSSYRHCSSTAFVFIGLNFSYNILWSWTSLSFNSLRSSPLPYIQNHVLSFSSKQINQKSNRSKHTHTHRDKSWGPVCVGQLFLSLGPVWRVLENTQSHSIRANWSPSPSMVAGGFLVRGGACVHFPFSVLRFCMPYLCGCHLYITPCCHLKTPFTTSGS